MNQQHTFNQYCSSSSSREFTFTQPNKPKTEEEKKKNRYEAVKRHRELMETVKLLENEELKIQPIWMKTSIDVGKHSSTLPTMQKRSLLFEKDL